MSAEYKIKQCGSLHTEEYRTFLTSHNGKLMSFLHDVPLIADKEKGIYNMVVEVPRWTNAKLEISKELPLNPIVQDKSKGAPRFVKNCFPYHGYIWNYGALPQTWEQPFVRDTLTNKFGDNDPLDALEIGSKVAYTGEIKKVKILGAVALIDDGECDWKILTIDVNDPLANSINTHDDIEKHFPGLLDATKEWFVKYKVPDGKKFNVIGCDNKTMSKDDALSVIQKCNSAWEHLIYKKIEATTKDYVIKTTNTTIENSPYKVSPDDPSLKVLIETPHGPPVQIPESVDKWYHIPSNK